MPPTKLTLDAITETVAALIAEHLGLDPSEVLLESNIVEDLGADSLDIVEITMDVEEEFAINISDEDAEKWETVNDIVELVDACQEER